MANWMAWSRSSTRTTHLQQSKPQVLYRDDHLMITCVWMHQTAVTAAGELHYINSADQEEQRVCKTESCKADDMAIHCEADATDIDDQEDEQDTNCECANAACASCHVSLLILA